MEAMGTMDMIYQLITMIWITGNDQWWYDARAVHFKFSKGGGDGIRPPCPPLAVPLSSTIAFPVFYSPWRQEILI